MSAPSAPATVLRSTTHQPSDYGLWLRLAAMGYFSLRTAEDRDRLARVPQLRHLCTEGRRSGRVGTCGAERVGRLEARVEKGRAWEGRRS